MPTTILPTILTSSYAFAVCQSPQLPGGTFGLTFLHCPTITVCYLTNIFGYIRMITTLPNMDW